MSILKHDWYIIKKTLFTQLKSNGPIIMSKIKPVSTIFLLGANDETTVSCVHTLCKQQKTKLKCFNSTNELIPEIRTIQPAILLICANKKLDIITHSIEILKKHKLFLPVIVLGETDDITAAVSSIQAGAFHYIEKPHIEKHLPEYICALVAPPTLILPKALRE